MERDKGRRKKGLFGNTQVDFEQGHGSAALRKRRHTILTAEQYQSTMVTLHFIQMRVFTFLERPSGWKCFVYHFTVFCLVLLCLILSVLDDDHERFDYLLLPMEVGMTCFFAVEYCVRCWAAGYHGKYAGLKGRLRFMRKPIAVIDLTVITASSIWLMFGGEGGQGQVFATSAFRGIRFLQILRMLHVDRQGGSWKLLMSVVYVHRTELITSMYIGFLCMIFASYFVYLSEKEMLVSEAANNSTRLLGTDITSFGDSLWWGIITVATVGYGDKVPRTWIGRSIASVYCIVATAFFALPSGILGSGFALKVQQTQRQKHFNRQVPPAATLIQTLWRMLQIEAAAKSHVHAQSASYRYFAHRCHTRKRSSMLRPPIEAINEKSSGKQMPKSGMFISSPLISIIRTTQNLYATIATDESIDNSNEDSEVVEDQTSLKVPAVSTVARTRRRSSMSCVPAAATSMSARYSDAKTRQTTQDDISIGYNPTNNGNSNGRVENKAESNDVCAAESTGAWDILSNNQRTMLLIVLRMKVFVAKRKFHQSRKPYDVRDVIEQYSQGNTNVVVRLKNLQRRVDSLYEHIERRNEAEVLQTVHRRVTVVEEQVVDLNKKMSRILQLLEEQFGNSTEQ